MSGLKENIYSWFTFKEEALLKAGAKPSDYRIKEAKAAAEEAATYLPEYAGDDEIAESCEADIKNNPVFFDYTSEEEKQKVLAKIKRGKIYDGDAAKLYEEVLEEIFTAPDFSAYFKGKTLDDLDEENHRISLPNAIYLAVSEMSKKSGTDYLHDFINSFSSYSSVEKVFNATFAEEMKKNVKKVRVDTHDDITPENNHVQGTWAHFIREWEIEEAKGITRSYPTSATSEVFPTKIVRTTPSPDIAGGKTQVFFEGAEEGHYLIDHGSEARFNYDPKGVSLALTNLRKFHDEEKVSVVTLHDMSVDALRDWVMASAMLELDGITMQVKMAPEMRAQVYTDEFNIQLEQRKALIQAEIAKRAAPNVTEEETKKAEEAAKAKKALDIARAEAEEARKVADEADKLAKKQALPDTQNEVAAWIKDLTDEEKANPQIKYLLERKDDFEKLLITREDLLQKVAAKADAFATLKELVVLNGIDSVKPEEITEAETELAKARTDFADFMKDNHKEINNLDAALRYIWTVTNDVRQDKRDEEAKKALDTARAEAEEVGKDATGLDTRIATLELEIAARNAARFQAILAEETARKEQEQKALRNAQEKSAREEAIDTRNLATVARKDATNDLLSEFLEEREAFAKNFFDNLSPAEIEEMEDSEEFKNFFTELQKKSAVYAEHGLLSSIYADKAEALAEIRERALENPVDDKDIEKVQTDFNTARDEFYAFIEANRNNGTDTDEFLSADKAIIAKIQEIQERHEKPENTFKVLGVVDGGKSHGDKVINPPYKGTNEPRTFEVRTFGNGTPVYTFNPETGYFESNDLPAESQSASELAPILNQIPSKRETREMAKRVIAGNQQPFYISSVAAMKNLDEFVRFAEEMSEFQAPFAVHGSSDEIRQLNEAVSRHEAGKAAQAKAKAGETNSPVVGKDLKKKAVRETVNNMTEIQARIGAFNALVNGAGIAAPVTENPAFNSFAAGYKPVEKIQPATLGNLEAYLKAQQAGVAPKVSEAEVTTIVEEPLAEETLPKPALKKEPKENAKKTYDLSSEKDKHRANNNKREWLSGVKATLFEQIIKNQNLSDEEVFSEVDKLNQYMDAYKKAVNQVITEEERKMDKNAILHKAIKQIGTFEKFEANSGVNQVVERKTSSTRNVAIGKRGFPSLRTGDFPKNAHHKPGGNPHLRGRGSRTD